MQRKNPRVCLSVHTVSCVSWAAAAPQDPSIWASLAAMAMAAKELSTAEVAFAAIDDVDKLHFVLKVKQIPTEEGRNAELALYRRRPDEAEAILIQVRRRAVSARATWHCRCAFLYRLLL